MKPDCFISIIVGLKLDSYLMVTLCVILWFKCDVYGPEVTDSRNHIDIT